MAKTRIRGHARRVHGKWKRISSYSANRAVGYHGIRFGRGARNFVRGLRNGGIAAWTSSSRRRRRATLSFIGLTSLGTLEMGVWTLTRTTKITSVYSTRATLIVGAFVLAMGARAYHKARKPSPFAPDAPSVRAGRTPTYTTKAGMAWEEEDPYVPPKPKAPPGRGRGSPTKQTMKKWNAATHARKEA